MRTTQLSRNFTLEEMIYSETASKVGGAVLAEQKSVIYQQNIMDNMSKLCREYLQPARDFINVPINITSGFRCYSLNKLIGGVENSDHVFGMAVDCTIPFTARISPEIKCELENHSKISMQKKSRNNNYYLFLYFAYWFHLIFDKPVKVIHEYGLLGEPDWVHISFNTRTKEWYENSMVLFCGHYTKHIGNGAYSWGKITNINK